EETVTVSGESPVVDVQSNSKAQVLPREVLDAVPTAHTIQGVGQLVVGVTLTAPDVGGSQAMQQTYFTVHGLGAAQTSLMMDGMIINGLQGDGAIQTYTNDAGNQEMMYQTGGGTVDSPTGGGGTLCEQGVDPQHQYSGLVRMTWQVSPRNKLSGYYDRIHKVRSAAMGAGDDQTTSSVVWNSPLYTTNMIKYTSTVSSKLLVEGGFSSNLERYNNLYAAGIEKQY